MQENEFEKQVKQKMDEFRLRPSEPVWPKIEEELRGRRRRLLIFTPLFAVMLLASYFAWKSYFRDNKISDTSSKILIKNNTDENKNSDTRSTDKITNPPSELKSETGNDKSVSKKIKDVPAVSTHAENVIKVEKDKNSNAGNNKSVSHAAIAKDNHNVILARIKKTDQLIHKDSPVTDDKEIKTNDATKKKNNLTQPGNAENNGAINTYQNNTLVVNEFAVDSKMQRDNEPVIINYRSPVNDFFVDSINAGKLMSLQLPSLKNQNPIGASNSIKLGITFSVGVSSRVNKALQISSADKNAPAVSSYANTSFSTLGGGVSIIPPSDIKPGVAFKIGVMAMKSISRRFDISAGLLYSYSSDHIRVGKSIGVPTGYYSGTSLDVLSQGYYSNSNVQNESYTNKYHYLELPVSVYYNLNRKWKIPVVWNAGVSVSRLVSSNVLLYDETWGGIYYPGNNAINKTQINISTGFSLRFTGSNRWQWNIGPQLYMSTTKLFQSEYDKNRRPVYGGLSVQLLLPAKKR